MPVFINLSFDQYSECESFFTRDINITVPKKQYISTVLVLYYEFIRKLTFQLCFRFKKTVIFICFFHHEIHQRFLKK